MYLILSMCLCVFNPHQREDCNCSPDDVDDHGRIRFVEPCVDDEEECTRKIQHLENNGVRLQSSIAVKGIGNDHLYGADPTDNFNEDLQLRLLERHAQHQAVVCNEEPLFVGTQCCIGTRRFETDLPE